MQKGEVWPACCLEGGWTLWEEASSWAVFGFLLNTAKSKYTSTSWGFDFHVKDPLAISIPLYLCHISSTKDVCIPLIHVTLIWLFGKWKGVIFPVHFKALFTFTHIDWCPNHKFLSLVDIASVSHSKHCFPFKTIVNSAFCGLWGRLGVLGPHQLQMISFPSNPERFDLFMLLNHLIFSSILFNS